MLPASALLAVALSACGPDPQSLGDACPDVPLYRYLFDTKTATWKRVSLSGGDAGEPLSADDLAKITAAEAHCVTPAGAATSEGTSSTPDAGAP